MYNIKGRREEDIEELHKNHRRLEITRGGKK